MSEGSDGETSVGEIGRIDLVPGSCSGRRGAYRVGVYTWIRHRRLMEHRRPHREERKGGVAPRVGVGSFGVRLPCRPRTGCDL